MRHNVKLRFNDTALVYFNGVNFDPTGIFNYYWDFTSNNIVPTPTTSNLINPAVFFPCNHTYKIMLIISRDSTDSTDAVADTINFTLYKPCCNNITPSIQKTLNNNSQNNELINLSQKYQINVFPNPTTGIVNVTCTDKNIVFSVEISDILKNILYLKDNFSGTTQINLSSNPKGVYFVKVITNEGNIFVEKVVCK